MSQDYGFSWETANEFIKLQPDSAKLCAYAAKFVSSFGVQESLETLKILKSNLCEANVGLYFKLIHNILPAVEDAALMEQIIKDFQAVTLNSAYQLKKETLKKALQAMPDSSPSSGFK